MRWIALVSAVTLAGCQTTLDPSSSNQPVPRQSTTTASTVPTKPKLQQFAQVVRTVEPVAERQCRARTNGLNCDFKIVVDDRPNQPANAFLNVG